MVRFVFLSALLASCILGPSRAEAGMITSITSGGSGGTASVLQTGDKTAVFSANLTSTGPIDFTFTVTDGDTYLLQFANTGTLGNVTNSTGLVLQSLQLTLLSARVGGAFVNGGSYQNVGPLTNGNVIGGGTAFQVSGPPNLNPGQASSIGVSINATRLSGPQTFTVRLTGTPAAGVVPEPASVVMTGLGLLGAVGYGFRRRRVVA